MQRALDKWIERNDSGFVGVRCIIRKAGMYNCFTDYYQRLETWFY
jgi:hypothetical protein